MDLSSAIEIYTTVLGWTLYDGIWQAIVDLGLLYIPIIVALVNTWATSYRIMGVDGADSAIRSSWLDIIAIFVVVSLAGNPAVTLDGGGLKHSRPCGAPVAAGGSTGTLYDKAFAALDGKTAQVPVWWYGIMALGNGLSNVGVALIPCSPDLRTFAYKIENTRVEDPELRRQLSLFARDCWQMARAKFFASHATLTAAYPPDDINWIGSQFFLDTDGYYGNANINLSMRASEEIPGFPYLAARDTEYLPGFIPNWGRPECKDWWLNATSGIKPRLLALVDFEAVNQATIETGDFNVANNALMRKILEPEREDLGRIEVGSIDDRFGGDSYDLSKSAANLGLAYENAFWRPKIYALRQTAPVGQSLILMGIFFFLPFVLLFSGFALETVFTLSVVIIGIQFLTPIWTLATWLDNHLMEGLGISWFEWELIEVSTDRGVAKQILNLAALLMFVVLPVLWFMMLGWAGFSLHKTFDSLNPVNAAVQNAANKGNEIGKNLAKRMFK